MVTDPETGSLIPFDFEQIKAHTPELSRLNYEIEVFSFSPIIDSSNMNPQLWKVMAEMIRDRYDSVDGFVILHGSDTMAFSASALSFMLKNLAKPVILTGSQLPIGEIRTDAKENLITALEIAAAKIDDKSVVPEVCIYFDNQLFRGNRSIKYNTEKFEAFRSPNYPVLAEAGVRMSYNHQAILAQPSEEFHIHTTFDANIGVIKLYPGITAEVIKAVTQSDVRAIILETFGSGNAPTEAWFLHIIEQAINSGKTVIDITQCKRGSVLIGKYETSSELQKMGVLSGFDMTYEATVTKLMYVLGATKNSAEIKALMETAISGELSI